MMREAFHPKKGPLANKSELEGERDALMHFIAGAVGRFENPTGHRFTGLDDPVTTIEIISDEHVTTPQWLLNLWRRFALRSVTQRWTINVKGIHPTNVD